MLWLGGISATLLLLRRGLLIRALPLLLLAISPVAIVFGQNYGGEASLRIVLFSSPWWSALIAWGLYTVRRRRLRLFISLAVAGLCAALFVPAFFGQEELNIVSQGELQASQYFYDHGRPGSVLLLSAPGFPYKYGSSYPQFRGPEGDADPNLLSARLLRHRRLGVDDVANVVSVIKQYSSAGYIAFSKEQTAYAEVFRLTPPGAMSSLEAAIGRSPDFRLWYGNRDARIYELTLKASTASYGNHSHVATRQYYLPLIAPLPPITALHHTAGRRLRQRPTRRRRGSGLRENGDPTAHHEAQPDITGMRTQLSRPRYNHRIDGVAPKVKRSRTAR